ncbi:hypothetical protein RJ55_05468 [Drechmeria coniospora]|nr:hypothetical protein RJ55_05468 [Drechmeria coniospora]
MAWQASGPRKKPLPSGHKQDDSSFPGLKPAAADTTTKIEYEELQQNELLALEAIYGEDFVKHGDAQSAWKKTEPAFDIHIRASTDEDFEATIGFVMTATYPKTPPLLTIRGLGGLREATQFKIQKFITTQPKVFAKDEQEMIDKIVEGVRDILEDAAQAKATGKHMPSLEEERETHEASLAKLVQEQKELDERRKQEETKEEERVMSQMLQKQLDRQRQKAKESRLSRRPNVSDPGRTTQDSMERIEFDQFCDSTDRDGNAISFRSVAGKCDARRGQVSIVYSVRPVLANGLSNQTLALKEAIVRSTGKDPNDFKKQLQSLETRLQHLKTTKHIHHRHLVDIIGFKVQSGSPDDPDASNTWTLRILSPLAEKGSLEELLELAGHLDISKVRSWTKDLLDALNFLHNKNIVHQDIHPRNILLFRESTGEIVPKIADASYQREIHNASSQKTDLPALNSPRSAYWLPPEIAAVPKPQYTYKTDIWDFGVVFVQMIFRLDVLQTYSSPNKLMESLSLSQSLQELVSRFFKEDKQKRPRAFELGASEFLATDAPIVLEGTSDFLTAAPPSASLQAFPMRMRRESMNRTAAISRYAEDFVEEARLGKGGFGEVVKARGKLDGQTYAIKKITQRSQASLTEILKEVRLLSQLSHPSVVRYYNTWIEEVEDLADTDGETSTDEYTEDSRYSGSAGIDVQFTTSTGGLDFMSSNANVEFGYDDDESDAIESEEESDVESDDDDESSILGDATGHALASGKALQRQSARFRRQFRTILYISMEYCEKRTLRDLISRQLYKNTPEIWRLFREILEGLAHIHAHSIVHRDLKPENIFIRSGVDGVDNVKIGDFGLATSGQFLIDRVATHGLETDDMTRSIGTAYYSAPEVRSASSGMYSTKVDMYSLGIIFFEMCYEPMLGMQKADVIGKLRQPKPVLPPDFKPEEKVQTDIVLSLVNHNPKERPPAADLLKGDMLPVDMESEVNRRIVSVLTDPSSPYYRKVLRTLFSRPVEPAKDYAWDMFATTNPNPAELLNQGVVKSTLTSIFMRHGALEMPRSLIYPRSAHYGDNVVQLLDTNGTVLQLPYDLTMGHARMMAKQKNPLTIQKTFTFGSVFRDRHDTGQPHMFGEVDFDIVTRDALDLALKEAEVLKVLDEIVLAFPSLYSGQMCFHVGHSDLLQLIFEHCGISQACRRPAADVLSKLNIHNHTWEKIRMELRSPTVGVTATSVEELARFDFRDSPNKAFAKLDKLFEGTDMYQRASPTIAHIKEVVEYTKRFHVSTKVYVNPLNSLKESFFVGGILFSCLYDKKTGKDVFAAGGRYDHLIKEQRPETGGRVEERHSVGFSLAWEKLARIPKTRGKSFLKKADEDARPHNVLSGQRCDILVASFDRSLLRSTGLEILQMLWSHDVRAELAKDARSPEDLLSQNRDETYSWIVIIKQDSMLKIKSMGEHDVPYVDLPMTHLMAWLRPHLHLRDRESKGSKASTKMRGSASQAEAATSVAERDHGQEVKVLVAQTRSKKFNRRTVVEQAQVSASRLVQSFLDGPILAVETTDQVMDLIRQTAITDQDSWRKAENAVTTTEKKYLRELHDQLSTWRLAFERSNGTRHAFIYNFRTGTCLYYDLGD